jgi:hypothetical protein
MPASSHARISLTAVGDGVELLYFQRRFGLLGHMCKLRAIGPDVGHLMRDDQMVLGVDGDLDIVTDDAGTSAAGRHRAGIGIGQRDLLVRHDEHLHLENLKTLHLLLQLLDLLLQAAGLGFERLGRLLPVGGVELLLFVHDLLVARRSIGDGKWVFPANSIISVHAFSRFYRNDDGDRLAIVAESFTDALKTSRLSFLVVPMSGYSGFRIAEDVPVGNESPGLIGIELKLKSPRPVLSKISFPPTLARGLTGSAVSALQKALKAFGATTDPGPIDGNFGPQTESAVRAYQSQQNIAVDGVVGHQTWWVPAGAAGATLASLAGLI